MKLIVGLGNPGKKYKNTRHNIGFLIIDDFVRMRDIEPFTESKKFHGLVTNGSVDGEKIILLKPSTYMNKSGISIHSVISYYNIEPKDVLVIHDEIDFPLAKVALKSEGGHAGHNGLRDIIAHLSTKEFFRLRIGVDRPATKEMVSDYVLGSFKSEEKGAIDDKRIDICNCCKEFINKK